MSNGKFAFARTTILLQAARGYFWLHFNSLPSFWGPKKLDEISSATVSLSLTLDSAAPFLVCLVSLFGLVWVWVRTQQQRQQQHCEMNIFPPKWKLQMAKKWEEKKFYLTKFSPHRPSPKTNFLSILLIISPQSTSLPVVWCVPCACFGF